MRNDYYERGPVQDPLIYYLKGTLYRLDCVSLIPKQRSTFQFVNTVDFPPVFDHLPVDAGFIRTESAGNTRLGVSGLDVTPQVGTMGGFKPTVFTQMSHPLVFHSSVTLQVPFRFRFVITKIAKYLCITVDGDQV